jgi:hypothetical protein
MPSSPRSLTTSAELPGERDAVCVATHDNDLLCAETPRGNHAAQAHGSVPDNRHGLAGADPGCDGSVVACSHHVREREERRQQRFITTCRQGVERSVRQGDAHSLGLRPGHLRIAEEASVNARRV